jgi:hypothetical protein
MSSSPYFPIPLMDEIKPKRNMKTPSPTKTTLPTLSIIPPSHIQSTEYTKKQMDDSLDSFRFIKFLGKGPPNSDDGKLLFIKIYLSILPIPLTIP